MPKKELVINRTAETSLHDLFDTYSNKGMGDTGYALHNAITHRASNLDLDDAHTLGMKGQSAVSTRLLNRHDWGRKVIRSDGFKDIVNYDEFLLAA